MATLKLKYKYRIKPQNPRLNLGNPIARKIGFYIPLHSKNNADISGNLKPIATVGTALKASYRGRAREQVAGDYVNYGDVHDIGVGSLTIGTWFRTTQAASSSYIGKSAAADSTGRYSLNVSSAGDLKFFVDLGASNSNTLTAMIWDDDLWHFAVGIYERGVGTFLYVDGVLVASDSNTTLLDFSTPFILLTGQYPDATGTAVGGINEFVGGLSDQFICHSVLSAREIKSLYDDFNQILAPITRYIDTTAAAAGGFQAAWAKNTNTLIGAL